MAVAVEILSGTLNDAVRRERVYSGSVLIFKDVEPMHALCALTDALVRDTFGDQDPLDAHVELSHESYLNRVTRLQERYRDGRAPKVALDWFHHVTAGTSPARTVRELEQQRAIGHAGGHG